MAEENDGQTTETPSAEDIAAARQLLMDNDHAVVPNAQFGARLSKEREPLETQLAELQAKREAEAAELKELRTAQAAREAEGKSELELLTERQQAWEAENAKSAAKLEEAQAQIAAAERRASRVELREQMRRLMSDPSPINDDIAILWAEKSFKGMAIRDGELVYTEATGIEHTGADAEGRFADWWKTQTSLHPAGTPGPPTNGAPKAVGSSTAPEPYKPLDPAKSTFAERMAHARKYKQQTGTSQI